MERYNIRLYASMPSVYGNTRLKFDHAGDGIVIEKSKDDLHRTITDEVNRLKRADRAVIVFFETSERLHEYRNSPYFKKVLHANVLEENADAKTRDYTIRKAATARQATFASAAFGRGTDFFCKDNKLTNAGGVHVLQTFLSLQKAEEVQIQGRTARQGKQGSFGLVLLEADLEAFGFVSGELASLPRGEWYNRLDEARSRKQTAACNEIEEALAEAGRVDALTHCYFDAVLKRRAGNEVPLQDEDFRCPISLTTMKDPVTAMDGHTYERRSIEAWLAGNDRSPMTNLVLPSKNLVPNHRLRALVSSVCGENSAAGAFLELFRDLRGKEARQSDYQVLFLVDRSGSMCSRDITPSPEFAAYGHNNRFGCAMEACHRFVQNRCGSGASDIVTLITFDGHASTDLHAKELRPDIITRLLMSGWRPHHGGTAFDSAFVTAENVVRRDTSGLPVLIMFLTDGQDGGNRNRLDAVLRNFRENQDVSLKAVGFGRDCSFDFLKSLTGPFGERGGCVSCVDEVQLLESFEAAAAELSHVGKRN